VSDWQDAQLGEPEPVPEPVPDCEAISVQLTKAFGRPVTWTPEVEAAMRRIFEEG
jgi:hypothetical protein